MRRRKFTTPYVVRDGKLMFWHDDDNGSCFGSYPEPTRWIKNIQADELMEMDLGKKKKKRHECLRNRIEPVSGN